MLRFYPYCSDAVEVMLQLLETDLAVAGPVVLSSAGPANQRL